jgi:hypothetical protein
MSVLEALERCYPKLRELDILAAHPVETVAARLRARLAEEQSASPIRVRAGRPLVWSAVGLAWSSAGDTLWFPAARDGATRLAIPDALRAADLVVEVVAGGLRKTTARFAHDLAVQVATAIRSELQNAIPIEFPF